ncbi:acyl carrier protein [Bordetella genomosp. 12]|uniref:Carrier domain-containing protein n=1 Tax=Bordetella genomosp. 12 TaxID=463035 RepID=A0A261VT61_9BORD|nr:acyl carrier protein [Bordetella genomosp. 12]OZI77304.1 hypothetical protein CAL22_01785 [Bordetella genomosp. 12]
MPTQLEEIALPATDELRQKLAEIVARVCNCDPQPLLDDQPFSSAVEQFDSLAVLEILLEIEKTYGIDTDEMLPVDEEAGAQEMTSIFPANLSALIDYMHDVIAQRPARQAAMQARIRQAQRKAGTPPSDDGHAPIETRGRQAPDTPDSGQRPPHQP